MSNIESENTEHETIIIQKTCPNCGNMESYKRITFSGVEYGVCTKCNKMTYSTLGGSTHTPAYANKPKVTCPFCQSTNCKKISGASKIGKVALFGVFAAGSVSKTWHCNNCGSNFG